MFRVPLCPSSGESILLICHLVYVNYVGNRQMCKFGWNYIEWHIPDVVLTLWRRNVTWRLWNKQNVFEIWTINIMFMFCWTCILVQFLQITNLTQILFSCIFIPVLYMFRALLCSSSGESIVLIRQLVYVTVCRWPSSVQVWLELHVVTYTRFRINLIKTKFNLLYIRNQSVPRCKHFPP